MTFIQPKKSKNLLNIILVVLAVAIFGETFLLVITYNKTVNATHNLASARAQLDTIGAENTGLNNQIVTQLGAGEISALAAQDNLVQEKTPHYFTLDKQWPIASH